MGAPTQDLFKRAETQIENAFCFHARADEAIARTSKLCDKASAQVLLCLDKRRVEVEEQRSKLIEQGKEVDKTIQMTEEHITRLKRPLAVSKRLAASSNKHKQIPKSVEELKAAEEKWAQLKSSEGVLAEMKLARRKLEDDIRCKLRAVQIDDACRILRSTGVDVRPQEQRDAHRLPKCNAAEPLAPPADNPQDDQPAT